QSRPRSVEQAESHPAQRDRAGVFRRSVSVRDGGEAGSAARNDQDLDPYGSEEPARSAGRGCFRMTCSELAGDYELYALGVLEEPDRGELREHLARNCEVCTAEVRRAAVRVSALSSLAPPVDPPKDLRKRVLASVGIHPQFRWNWMQTWATVAAAVVLAMFWVEHLRRERIREVAFQDAMQQVKQSEEELALMNSPETIVPVSWKGALRPPQGEVFPHPNRGVLLRA